MPEKPLPPPRRRAERTYERDLKGKLGMRRAETCKTCEFCRKRVDAKRRGKPRKRVTSVREVRSKNSVRGRLAEGYKMKVRSNLIYWCTLAWCKTTKTNVCNFHLETSVPIDKKQELKIKPQRLSRLQKNMWDVREATLNKLRKDGVPRRPQRPESLKELRNTEIPEDFLAYIDDHWELIADELLRYRLNAYRFKREWCRKLGQYLSQPSLAEQERKVFFFGKQLSEIELTEIWLNEWGFKPPRWKWDEVMDKIANALNEEDEIA